MRDQSNIRLQDSHSKYKYKPRRPMHIYRARGRLLRDLCPLRKNAIIQTEYELSMREYIILLI